MVTLKLDESPQSFQNDLNLVSAKKAKGRQEEYCTSEQWFCMSPITEIIKPSIILY